MTAAPGKRPGSPGSPGAPDGPGVERLLALAALGAQSAGSALTRLAGRALRPGAPVLRPPGAPADTRDWATGIFFDLEGDLAGEIAILLSARLRAAAVATGLDGFARPMPAESPGESLLLELGNIVASRTLSSIADAQGSRILLSIPTLVARRAGRELGLRAARWPQVGSRVDIDFADRSGDLRALLVLVARPPRDGA